MSSRVSIAATLTVLGIASLANAQTLSGRVTRAGVPVSGVVIALADETGLAVARTVSREQGAYTLSVTRPGNYRVRALQIGWRPTAAGPFALAAGATTTANIELTSARVALEAIVVTGRSDCRVNSDTSAAAFLAWEEARTALIATSVTRAEPLTMSSTVSDRTLDRASERVLTDSTSSFVGRSLNPFVSLHPDSLARVGFVTREPTGEHVYWAPDADVLLSESFLSSHCLRVEQANPQNADGARLIGVAFTPARTRRGVVDVAGTVWLDRASAELRSIDYEYVNTSPAVERSRPGGRVEFSRIPGGRWIVDRWSIRYPILAIGARRPDVPVVPGQVRAPQPTEDLAAIKTTTGQVAEIRRGNDVLWQRGRVSVTVRVVDSTTGAPLRGVLVRSAESTSATATDSGGAVRLDRLPPGALTVRLESADLASIGTPFLLAAIEVPTVNDAAVTVRAASARAVAAARCGSRSLEWGEGLLRGRVAAGGPSPVVVTWQTTYARLGGGEPVVAEEQRTVTPSPTGEFEVCGVPRDARVSLRRDGGAKDGASVEFRRGAVAAFVLVP